MEMRRRWKAGKDWINVQVASSSAEEQAFRFCVRFFSNSHRICSVTSPSAPRKEARGNVPSSLLSDSLAFFLSRLRVLFSQSPFCSSSRVMEDYAEFRGWEVLDFDAGEECMKPLHERVCSGSILSDYFALGAQERRRKGATFNGNAHEEEIIEAAALVDSKSPSWVDPELNSQFLDKAKEDVGFRGTELSPGDFGGFRFHESSNEQRSHFGGEKDELGGAEAFEVGEIIHGDDKADKEVDTLGIGENQVIEMGFSEACGRSTSRTCKEP